MGFFIDLLLISSTAASGWIIWRLHQKLNVFKGGIETCWDKITDMDNHFAHFVKKHNELVAIVERLETLVDEKTDSNTDTPEQVG